ncbi:hypothetical protein HT118_05935 [Escherichia coli]|nr:hypothetical protein [Escherichia coli]
MWFVPSGAVKDDLRHATLVALPVPGHGAGEPIGILTRVDATFSSGCQLMINAIRKINAVLKGEGICRSLP